MAGSGAQSISVDECMSLDMIGEIAREHNIGFIGNFHTTGVLFEESESSIEDARRCVEMGTHYPGYVFGLGAPITQYIDSSRLEKAVIFVRSHGTPTH